MSSPEQNPRAPRPDQASTGGPIPLQQADPDQQAHGNPEVGTTAEGARPESTQENMGDGAGIRGEYGTASQTNGLEGGPSQTDTELTGS